MQQKLDDIHNKNNDQNLKTKHTSTWRSQQNNNRIQQKNVAIYQNATIAKHDSIIIKKIEFNNDKNNKRCDLTQKMQTQKKKRKLGDVNTQKRIRNKQKTTTWRYQHKKNEF